MFSSVGITIGIAFGAWAISWLFGNLLGSGVVGLAGDASGDDIPVWLFGLGAALLWACALGALWWVSRQFGTNRWRTDYGWGFAPSDLAGIPIGVAVQVAVIPALYWLLRRICPTTFDTSRVERYATDLVDRTNGLWWIVLVAVTVVGAPVIEELIYRGLIYRPLAKRLGPIAAVVLSAAFFALIHFRPVEYPGLFVVGLVLAGCVAATGRLGLGIVTHLSFNATALIMTANR